MSDTEHEPESRGDVTRLFQIKEDDLATLERDCARLCDELSFHLTNRHKAMVRRIQRILCDVRWNYGPPMSVERFPADEDPNS